MHTYHRLLRRNEFYETLELRLIAVASVEHLHLHLHLRYAMFLLFFFLRRLRGNNFRTLWLRTTWIGNFARMHFPGGDLFLWCSQKFISSLIFLLKCVSVCAISINRKMLRHSQIHTLYSILFIYLYVNLCEICAYVYRQSDITFGIARICIESNAIFYDK